MRWVTWENVGIDRMARAWLIERDIDPELRFVPRPAVPPSAPETAEEALDMPGVHLSHRHGHCIFYTMLREYGLQEPVLTCVARLVDEADTLQEAPGEPEAIGVDGVCRGISQICRDDAEALAKGYFVGLYAHVAGGEDATPNPFWRAESRSRTILFERSEILVSGRRLGGGHPRRESHRWAHGCWTR